MTGITQICWIRREGQGAVLCNLGRRSTTYTSNKLPPHFPRATGLPSRITPRSHRPPRPTDRARARKRRWERRVSFSHRCRMRSVRARGRGVSCRSRVRGEELGILVRNIDLASIRGVLLIIWTILRTLSWELDVVYPKKVHLIYNSWSSTES